MNINSVLLIFVSIASCATSQDKFNISGYDSQLRDIFNGLVETEKKIGNFLGNLNDFVDGIGKSNKSRFSLDLNHLQLVLQLQSSIGNFESYQQLTGCANVASKISEIDVDMKKFGHFVDRLELNMTELYHRNLHVTYDFVLYRNVQTSQQDMLDLILGVNEAIVQYLYYILQLQSNIQYEKSIAKNLGYFMTSSCKCSNSSSDVGQMTESFPSVDNLESSLVGKQARVLAAANATLNEAQKLAQSKNLTGKLKGLTKKVSVLCRKIGKIGNFSRVPSLATNSCSILFKNQNFLVYRKFQFTQVLSFVSTSTAVLEFYKKTISDRLTGNSTLDPSLNSSISALNSSLSVLSSELKRYEVELKYQLSSTGITSIIRRNKLTIDTCCGCTAGGTDTTTGGLSMTTSLTSTVSKNLATTSIPATKPSTTSKSTQQATSSKTSTTLTSSGPKTTPKISPSIPPTGSTSTTSPPYSNPACSFTKPFADMTGTYIKTACLMETASNGSYGSSLCQDKSMKLMTVDSNMTQTAVTIFVQETLSEGNFWISGGNGSEICNFLAVDESGSAINQTECSSRYYSYYSICEYKDPKVPSKVSFSPNLDACGIVFPILTELDKEFTRYACVMAYTRSYTDSNYNCMLNGMKMFSMTPKLVIKSLNQFLVSYFGNSSGIIMWVDATAQTGSCAFLDGNKAPFEIGSGNCDQLSWSICETPYDGSY